MGLAVAALVCSFANTSRAGCEKDTDCKGDRICHQGDCAFLEDVRPPAPPPEPGCTADADCEGAEQCVSGVCTAPPDPVPGACQASSDCRVSEKCVAGVCADEPGLGPGECKVASDCRVSEICVRGICIDREPVADRDVPVAPSAAEAIPTGRCRTDLDCPATHECDRTVCVQRTERASVGAMIAGIALVGVAVISAPIGIGLVVGGQDGETTTQCRSWVNNVCQEYATATEDDSGMTVAGTVVLVSSGTFLLTGIVLAAVGGMEEPVEADGAASPAAVSVVPLVGPTGGGVRVRF